MLIIESGQIENQDKKNVNEFENLPNAFFGMVHDGNVLTAQHVKKCIIVTVNDYAICH